MHAVAEHRGGKAAVAVRNHDGRVGGVEPLCPGRDSRIDRLDGRVGERQGDDQVNLQASGVSLYASVRRSVGGYTR